MTAVLSVLRAGPAMSVQDLGRPGHMGEGLSHGGAADREAFLEGVALLDQTVECAAIEMAAFGGDFTVSKDIRIALTGAPMVATCDGEALAWNASHLVKAGKRLSIGAARSGVYAYLHVGGGVQTQPFLESRSTHLTAGIGTLIATGQELPVGTDAKPNDVNKMILPEPRFEGGTVRILPSVQTQSFSQDVLERFQATVFKRSPRANRQGLELVFEGEPFGTTDQLTILSEPMVAGDIQMTGEGAPFVLLPECQTTGGYPRIGTVLPVDLPIIAQAGPGHELRFRFVEYDAALHSHKSTAQRLTEMTAMVSPMVRDPHDMRDLLAYQLVGGVVDALNEAD